MSFKEDIGQVSITGKEGVAEVEWRISDFSSLSDEDGAFYRSLGFSSGGHEWRFWIYPKGSSSWNSCGFIHLFLVKLSSSPCTDTLHFAVSLRHVNGQKECEEKVSGLFGGELESIIIPPSVSTAELLRRRSEFLPSDELTVVLTLNWGSSPTSAGVTTKEECCHCKGTFYSDSILSHQRKCAHRPIICPDCSESVPLVKCWFGDHECQKQNAQGEEELQENCGRIYAEASTQTEEENEAVKEPTAAEVSRVVPSEVAESDLPETSDSNQISDTGIKATVEPINLPEERDLVTAISDFWSDGRGVDVTFELETPGGKTKFSAHTLVLALKSAYFADEFYGQGRNKEHRVIPLEGINPKAFEQMIKHCYDFEPCLETIEDICALYNVAYKFHVTSLISLCRTYFKDNKVVPGNVFSVLEISKQLEDERVCDMCYKILEEKTKEVIAAYELSDISPNMVRAILDLPKLSLNSEYELIHWIFEWTKVKTGDKDSTCKNRRQYLEKFLQNMDFLSLTTEEFARLCKENPNFFSSEEIASISLNIAFPGSRDMPSWYDKELVLPRQRFAIYSKLCQGSAVSSKFYRVYTGNNK